MSMYTRAAVLAAGGLLLAGCDIVITPDRVESGSTETITVTPDTSSGLTDCVDGSTVEVFLNEPDATETLLGETMSVDGDWVFEFEAPADAGAYSISIECDREGEGPIGIPEELVVDPEFAPVASPAGYAAGSAPASVLVEGNWCISSTAFSIGPGGPVEGPELNPEVSATLSGENRSAQAASGQPFGEQWSLDFPAPTAPGTYPVDVTCDYSDVDSETGGLASVTPAQKTAQTSVVVSGLMTVDPAAATEGDPLTVTNDPSSLCEGGDVTVRALLDGTETASVEAVVAVDGSWTAELADLGPGDYTIEADCDRDTGTGPFPYEVLSATVTAGETPTTASPTTTTTTTTTAPPAARVQAQSAQPVAAQPGLTG